MSRFPDDLPETEQANPAAAALDRLSTEEIVDLINTQDAQIAAAVRLALPEIARAVDAIVDRLRRGGRLFYVGAGTSGRVGLLDAAEWGPTFSTPAGVVQAIIAGGADASAAAVAGVEDDADAGAADIAAHGVWAGDVVVGLTASGTTPYVVGALTAARKTGAATISVVCNPGPTVRHVSDITILAATGPEIVAGSTRMKAGTAQKMVVNMVSTAVNVKLGKVFGNLMVDVQPLNRKLVERAHRIIAEGAGVSLEDAASFLDAAGGNVKAALVMAATGVDLPEARRRLDRTGGVVRDAIAGRS